MQNTPLSKDFFHAKMTPENKDFSVVFSHNLTPKGGFVQKFTPKSDRILENVPYFLKMAVFDTDHLIPFSVQKTIIIHSFHSHACLQYYTLLPLPPPHEEKHVANQNIT